MIWVWLLLGFQFTWITPGLGDFHQKSSKWFTAALKKSDAYFGFSVTYEPTNKRLIVSAPQGDDIGEIYSCDIDKDTCTPVLKDIKRSRDVELYKHNYWLGAVVKAGPSYFVTCAPLFAEHKKYHTTQNVVSSSRCYKFTSPDPSADYKSSVLNSINPIELQKGTRLYEHEMTTFGWSIDTFNSNVMIGGPAMFTGRALWYYDMAKTPKSLTGYKTNGVSIVDYNFGYSVVSGNFTYSNKLIYAIGSPYGKNGYGKVTFYTIMRQNMIYSGYIEGWEQMLGAMFGAVLCSARLTSNPNTHALLVGAPTYTANDKYNRGAVFVYAPSARKLPLTKKIKEFIGYESGSQFGSAIVSVGDMNGDGLDEIAIGAPYEDSGKGAVYLYSSKIFKPENKEVKWLQRIVAEPSQRQLTFGYSLTALQDYDQNGCNELAIGAPETNKVMLLRCTAFVQVKVYAVIPDLRQFKNKSLTFQSCLNVTYPEKPKTVDTNIKMQVEVIHSKAKLANPEDAEYIIHLDRSKNSICKDITVSVSEIVKISNETLGPINIIYKIKATQLIPPEDEEEFDAKHVGLSDLSELKKEGPIWITECSKLEQCIPDLSISDFELSVDTPYEIGSTKSIEMSMKVRNDGEVAYDPCLFIDINDAQVLKSSSECDLIGDARLKCVPKLVLRTNKTWEMELITLDTTQLTSKNTDIRVQVDIYNHCTENKYKRENKYIALFANPDKVAISGITNPQIKMQVDTVIMTRPELTTGVDFYHEYTIKNFGNTSWIKVNVAVVVQKRDFIENSPIIVFSEKSQSPDFCDTADDDDTAQTTFTCNIDTLYNNSFVKVTVPMTVKAGTDLEAIINGNKSTVFSNLSIQLTNGKISVDRTSAVTSTMLLKEIFVDWWIYLIAIIMGLLILIILVFILRSCGFFERKNKEQLEKVQRHVKRQTIMRRSMLDGVRVPPGQDQQLLIASEAAQQASSRDRRVQP